MAEEPIHDRGRGPEIVGTRITVYNLLPHFLDATVTEAEISQIYGLTPEQVAAARAYVLNHADTVLARHLEIEQRLAIGNPPEIVEQAKQLHESFVRFKTWLATREKFEASPPAADATKNATPGSRTPFPTFREWMANQQPPPARVH